MYVTKINRHGYVKPSKESIMAWPVNVFLNVVVLDLIVPIRLPEGRCSKRWLPGWIAPRTILVDYLGQ